MKEGETVEPMFSWERSQIEQARLALRKAKLGSAAELFGKALSEGGIPAAEKKLKELLKERPNGPVFDEADFNVLGYRFAAGKQPRVGPLCVREEHPLYPSSGNAWDSLGEVPAKAGRNEQAIASYRKSLELDPKNKNGQAMLEKLMKGQ